MLKSIKRSLVIAFALSLLISLFPQLTLGLSATNNLFPIDLNKTQKLIDTISTFGSRMTGYKGYYNTLNYLYGYFKNQIGIIPSNNTYKVLVPIQEKAYIEVLSPFHAIVKAYSLYPNGVNPSSTPPEGIIGKLIYVKTGELSNFNGKEIKGNIVAMDFNSMNNWLKALDFGAKAVVFIEPESTTYTESYSKFLDTPISFPRVYVKKSDWAFLKKANVVRLVSIVKWKEINATNLIVKFKGTKYPNKIIILSTHFDSWSVVPALASSKTELIPVALLMQYASYLKDHPPKYTVLMIFFSGHWQTLTGAREFVEDYFFNKDIQSGKKQILGQINFDLMASDSDGLQLLHASYYTTYGGNGMQGGGFPARLSWFMTEIDNILGRPEVNDFVKRNFRVPNATSIVSMFFSTSGFWGTEPIPYMLDSEPASISGIPAFSITTRRSSRIYIGIPTDDSDFANIEKMGPLLQLALYITDSLLRSEWNFAVMKPTRYDLTSAHGFPGYASFFGRVVTYNFTKGWYDPVPNAIVEAQLVSSTYKLNKIIVRADNEGRFVIHGIPISGSSAGGGTVIPFSQWTFRGWIFSKDGKILMATDLGQFGMRYFPQVVMVLHSHENVTVAIAKVSSVEISDVNLPGTLTTPTIIDPRTGYFDKWLSQSVVLLPFNIITKSIPISYGYYCNGWEPVALVWTQPYIHFTVVGYITTAVSQQGTPQGGQIFLLLTNSTANNTEGYGYYLHYGETLKVHFTALAVAKNFYYTSYGRYLKFVARHIGTPSADITLKKSKEYINKAESYLKAEEYSKAYAYALIARAYAYKAYSVEVMPLINDASSSMLFMFFVIIFGGFFLEKITVHEEGLRRLVTISVFITAFLAVYSFMHPAFSIMSNVPLGLVGSIVLIVLLLVIVLLGMEGERVRKSIEIKVLGVHRREVSRLDTTMTAFSLGSEYIRRRPLRAILMLLTIIMMVIAIVSFTSLTPARVSMPVTRVGYTPRINEVLIKVSRGAPPGVLSSDMVTVLKTFAGDKFYVLPRVWVYGPVDRGYWSVVLPIYSSTKNATIPALLGITPEEFNLIYKRATSGWGIVTDSGNYAVISKPLAQNISATVGDTIYIEGKKYVITGIVNYPEEIDAITEADGFSPMPVNPIFFPLLSKDIAVAAQAGAVPPNLGTSTVIIVPFKRALELGGYIASVAMIPKTSNVTYEDEVRLAEELGYALDTTIYVSHGGIAKQISTFSSILVGGFSMIVMVLILGALNITIMFLGNLKERTKEIYVFSSVGLSPMGVTVFFTAEALVYAFVGILIGYPIAYGVTWLMYTTGAFPSTHIFNFASISTIIGILTIILASLAAVVYPSRMGSRIVTPSFERKWKLRTKPRGDEWEIPLPISVAKEEEAKGILAYLHEYYTGAGEVKEGIHMVRSISKPDYAKLALRLIVGLAPFEMGVTQEANVYAVIDRRTNRYIFVLYLKRLTGPKNIWQSSNYLFADDLRKQLLMWRSLPVDRREKYVSEALRLS